MDNNDKFCSGILNLSACVDFTSKEMIYSFSEYLTYFNRGYRYNMSFLPRKYEEYLVFMNYVSTLYQRLSIVQSYFNKEKMTFSGNFFLFLNGLLCLDVKFNRISIIYDYDFRVESIKSEKFSYLVKYMDKDSCVLLTKIDVSRDDDDCIAIHRVLTEMNKQWV